MCVPRKKRGIARNETEILRATSGPDSRGVPCCRRSAVAHCVRKNWEHIRPRDQGGKSKRTNASSCRRGGTANDSEKSSDWQCAPLPVTGETSGGRHHLELFGLQDGEVKSYHLPALRSMFSVRGSGPPIKLRWLFFFSLSPLNEFTPDIRVGWRLTGKLFSNALHFGRRKKEEDLSFIYHRSSSGVRFGGKTVAACSSLLTASGHADLP